MASTNGRVEQHIDAQWDEQVRFLQDLVRQPTILGNQAAEWVAQERMRLQLHAMGLDVTPIAVDQAQLVRMPGYSPVEWPLRDRPMGVVGVWRSERGGGRSLVLNGHLDVVDVTPLRQWRHDPFGGQIEGGRMYGRGACDMKSGVSAMVFAVRALQAAGVELAGDVIVQSVLEEECTGNGTNACIARGFVGDACLIPEPFNQSILTAEVGALWLRVTVFGSAGHTQGASTMVNAIDKAYELIASLRELERRFNEERHPAFADHPHPLNFNPGLIRGGNWPSSVPSECEFTMRIGFYPGVEPEDVKRRVLAHLRETIAGDDWLRGHPPEFSWYGHHDRGTYEPHPEANPLIQTVQRAHRRLLGQDAPYLSATAVTDIRFWTEYLHKPATCYGPSGGQMHAPDEWVDLESVRATTKVLAAAIMDWCGVADA